VIVLVSFVREPEPSGAANGERPPLSFASARRLGAAYWWVTAVATVFSLARFSEAFLLLRAQSAGLAIALVPLVLVVMNAAYGLAAYPAGALSDRVNRVTVLVIGLLLLIAADLLLALDAGLLAVAAGTVLWGVHMGFTQGLLASLVADTAPADLRGTAFGVFYMLGGGALLIASVVAGLLWDVLGAGTTFLAGAGFAAAALAGLLAIRLLLPSLGTSDQPGSASY
jgi:MFS family permease